ncbi:MAG: histidine phosphatase family protein [Bacillota bacterium]|nr:histidine phosphatase family protein [Bacillota bacterium]
MKKLYFTRHGQTTWNVKNKICGKTDVELTDLGKEQAKMLAQKIKEQEIHLDGILYSPLIRAKETALIISKEINVPAYEEPLLIEQCFGKFEGTSPRNASDFVEAKKQFINSYESGESMFRLAQRIYNLLDQIKKDEKVYLLVAHNGISRVIESYFRDMTNEEYACFGIKNCELKQYEI